MLQVDSPRWNPQLAERIKVRPDSAFSALREVPADVYGYWDLLSVI